MGGAAPTGAECWNCSTGPLQDLQPLVKGLFVWKFRKVALTQVPTGKAGLIPVGGLPPCPDPPPSGCFQGLNTDTLLVPLVSYSFLNWSRETGTKLHRGVGGRGFSSLAAAPSGEENLHVHRHHSSIHQPIFKAQGHRGPSQMSKGEQVASLGPP